MNKMTKSSLRKQVEALLKESMARGIKRIDVLMNSGTINIEGKEADNLGLAKVLASCIPSEEAIENRPLAVVNLKLLKNLEHF
jgi:hypothetical protein